MPRAGLLRARARQRCRTSPGYRAGPWGWSRPRSRSRCRCRSWCAGLDGRLDGYSHRRSCFEEVDRGVCSLWRLIGIEPEVIQCAPANRIRVLIVCKSISAPRQRIGSLIRRPWRAAISLTVQCAIVCPPGMLRRSVKSNVTDVNSSSQRHTKGLNRAIQVHVIHNVLIVPDSRRRVGYFVAHKPEAVVSRVRFLSGHRRACPCPDGRLHSRGVTYW